MTECMQHERWQREVVDPVDLRGDCELRRVVRVDLHEHLDAALVRAARNLADERERLREHEAGRAAFLDRITRRVEPDGTYAGAREPVEDRHQVLAPRGVVHVDVDLVRRERGP